MIEIPQIKVDEEVITIVPEIERNQFLNHFYRKRKNKHAFRNYLFFRTILETGLRFREITNLKLINIEFGRRVILVKETKAKRERFAYMSPELASLMFEYVNLYEITEYVFSDFNNNKLTHMAINNIIMRARKTLQIPKDIKLSCHIWRHTFATNFIRKGGNAVVLRDLLGHKDLEVTMRYVHLDSEHLRKQYNETFGYKD